MRIEYHAQVSCNHLRQDEVLRLLRVPMPPLAVTGLLEALHSESPIAEDSPTASDLLGPVYEPPTESSLLQDGLIEPVSNLSTNQADCSYCIHSICQLAKQQQHMKYLAKIVSPIQHGAC